MNLNQMGLLRILKSAVGQEEKYFVALHIMSVFISESLDRTTEHLYEAWIAKVHKTHTSIERRLGAFNLSFQRSITFSTAFGGNKDGKLLCKLSLGEH